MPKNTQRSRLLSTNKMFAVLALILAFSLLITACAADSAGLSEGDQAPGFSLPSATGDPLTLEELNSGQPVLLYFHMALG